MPVKYNLPSYPYPPYPEQVKEKLDNPGGKYPFASEEITTGIREATITEKPYPVKGWFVYGTNLIHALPNEAETIKAIQNLDLMVVVDVIPSEIAGWADVVLPESVYLERHDEFNTSSFREPFVSIRQPVVEAPHDQKPNWWIAKKLAEKLGLGKYFPWKNIEEYLQYRSIGAGIDFDELKKAGVMKAPRQPIFYEEGVTPEFYTPSGKIEFYSLQLLEKGFDPVPKYEKPPDPPAGYFRLLYGRSPVHSFSRTQSNRVLADMMDENELWVNNNTALRYGFKSGDRIRLKNSDGTISNKIKVKVTERIRHDCLYMVHGFGHNAKLLKGPYMKGASDAQITNQIYYRSYYGRQASTTIL